MNKHLPYGQHLLDEDDIAAVVNVLRGNALTCGPQVELFEQTLAEKIGVREAVVTSNGTTALHLAVIAAGIGEGDVVIVPAITFLATANVVEMQRATVCFADVDPSTGLMTPALFKEAIEKANSLIKAVMPVHMTGQSEAMAEIKAIADDNGIAVITDCCHALGAEYTDGGNVGDGQYEDFACFSFHPVKSIAMGEGGAIATNSVELAQYMRQLRSHDMKREPESFINSKEAFDAEGTANPWYYEMHQIGYNYRATDIQCALGVSQLKKSVGFIEKRRSLAQHYDRLFNELNGPLEPNRRSGDCISAWHLYAVRVSFDELGMSRAKFMTALKSAGIGTQVHYIPVSKQPYYTEKYGEQYLPGAEDYYQQTLSLPLFPAMTEEDVERVVLEIKKIIDA